MLKFGKIPYQLLFHLFDDILLVDGFAEPLL